MRAGERRTASVEEEEHHDDGNDDDFRGGHVRDLAAGLSRHRERRLPYVRSWPQDQPAAAAVVPDVTNQPTASHV